MMDAAGETVFFPRIWGGKGNLFFRQFLSLCALFEQVECCASIEYEREKGRNKRDASKKHEFLLSLSFSQRFGHARQKASAEKWKRRILSHLAKKKRIHSFPHFPSFSFCRVFTTTPLSFFLLGCFVSAKQVPFFRTRQHYLASFERGRQSCHLLFLRFLGAKKGISPPLARRREFNFFVLPHST